MQFGLNRILYLVAGIIFGASATSAGMTYWYVLRPISLADKQGLDPNAMLGAFLKAKALGSNIERIAGSQDMYLVRSHLYHSVADRLLAEGTVKSDGLKTFLFSNGDSFGRTQLFTKNFEIVRIQAKQDPTQIFRE